MMKQRSKFGAKTQMVNLSRHLNWPDNTPKDEWWQRLADSVEKYYPTGIQRPWGVTFLMAESKGPRAILVTKNSPKVTIPLKEQADFICLLHQWEKLPQADPPMEGLVIAEYILTYVDGSSHIQPVRGRFEVNLTGAWDGSFVAVPFSTPKTLDPSMPTGEFGWGLAQQGLYIDDFGIIGSHIPLQVYAMPNPNPEKKLQSLTIRGLNISPLLVGAITLFQGASHPLRYLPRRGYRVNIARKPVKIEKVEVDLGDVARKEHTPGPCNEAWLKSSYVGMNNPWNPAAREPERKGEDVLHIFGAPDATVAVTLEGQKNPLNFSLGEAFQDGISQAGRAVLEVLGQQRQWMRVKVIDSSTGQPTPVRIHFSGPRGEYIAPYGHHEQINPNWFEDYGADVIIGGKSYAYVHGEFTTDLPVGDLYVELWKGFEYQPTRVKATIRPGQKELRLKINRWIDLRSKGWITADTHVHFISPQTAWLEGQCEGVNVINLLASQWGRLFTNVGDLSGKVGVADNDVIVYVGTENRNHMLGHMSMLGTQGEPVYPMCSGGPSEAWVGDPDFRSMAEWCLENRSKGGIVIRPHFPGPNGENPIPIIKGLVDALEIADARGSDFATQEWYRYLNCGYKVAVCGGTDKMAASWALGWLRTYAKLDPNRPFTYDNWAKAVRAGRTVTTSGPIMDLSVDGKVIGDTIKMATDGGTGEVCAIAESFWPLGRIEIVHNGRVVASSEAKQGAKKLQIREKIQIGETGWIAARCTGYEKHPGSYVAAHTSPIYINCGDRRAFDGSAAMHMLALTEGCLEYMQTLSTTFDEASLKRMIKLFKEVQRELKGRFLVEARHRLHSGNETFHIHGEEREGHRH